MVGLKHFKLCENKENSQGEISRQQLFRSTLIRKKIISRMNKLDPRKCLKHFLQCIANHMESILKFITHLVL